MQSVLGYLRDVQNILKLQMAGIFYFFFQLFLIPKPNTELFKKSFTYSALVLWNNLPNSIRNSPSVNSFKVNVKQILPSLMMKFHNMFDICF